MLYTLAVTRILDLLLSDVDIIISRQPTVSANPRKFVACPALNNFAIVTTYDSIKC